MYTHLHVLHSSFLRCTIPHEFVRCSKYLPACTHCRSSQLKFDWTQEMKLHETPHSKKHISSNRAIDSHQRPESSNLLLDIHQFHLAPWVRFSWMTTGLWYDQCWPSSQFMYLLWIVHEMIPRRGGTVWDVEVCNQKSTLPYSSICLAFLFGLCCISFYGTAHYHPFSMAETGISTCCR